MSTSYLKSTSYRDRTPELFAVAERLRKAGHGPKNGETSREKSMPSLPTIPGGLKSEFNRKASRIGLSIHQTTQKLERLTKLAKRTSMFDDPAVEIQELTAVIKQDITMLNTAIEELQRVGQSHDNSSHNKHTSDHTVTVVDNLKNRLMGATKGFKDALTIRTENMKIHESRRQLFSANSRTSASAIHSSLSRQRSMAANGNGSASSWESAPLVATPTATQLFNTTPIPPPFMDSPREALLQQEHVAPAQNNFMQTRAEALHNVESTIVELGTIFQNLSVMVQQQGEVAIRIDQDVEDTLGNVEGAQFALLAYFNKITLNRWLLLKIFSVMLLFLLIFVVFIV